MAARGRLTPGVTRPEASSLNASRAFQRADAKDGFADNVRPAPPPPQQSSLSPRPRDAEPTMLRHKSIAHEPSADDWAEDARRRPMPREPAIRPQRMHDCRGKYPPRRSAHAGARADLSLPRNPDRRSASPVRLRFPWNSRPPFLLPLARAARTSAVRGRVWCADRARLRALRHKVAALARAVRVHRGHRQCQPHLCEFARGFRAGSLVA